MSLGPGRALQTRDGGEDFLAPREGIGDQEQVGGEYVLEPGEGVVLVTSSHSS